MRIMGIIVTLYRIMGPFVLRHLEVLSIGITVIYSYLSKKNCVALDIQGLFPSSSESIWENLQYVVFHFKYLRCRIAGLNLTWNALHKYWTQYCDEMCKTLDDLLRPWIFIDTFQWTDYKKKRVILIHSTGLITNNDLYWYNIQGQLSLINTSPRKMPQGIISPRSDFKVWLYMLIW